MWYKTGTSVPRDHQNLYRLPTQLHTEYLGGLTTDVERAFVRRVFVRLRFSVVTSSSCVVVVVESAIHPLRDATLLSQWRVRMRGQILYSWSHLLRPRATAAFGAVLVRRDTRGDCDLYEHETASCWRPRAFIAREFWNSLNVRRKETLGDAKIRPIGTVSRTRCP